MRGDFVTVDAQEDLLEALSIMRLGRLRHLLVEQDGHLVGILSYRDLQEREIQRLQGDGQKSPRERSGGRVGLAMETSPFAVDPRTSLTTAASRMADLRIGCLPVVESDGLRVRLVGVITEVDLLRAAYPIW